MYSTVWSPTTMTLPQSLLYQRKRRRQTPSLTSLPRETLTEILTYLSWRDVLYVRRTCLVLNQASKEFSVWRALVHKELINVPSTIHPDRPVEAYTSRELERMLLRTKSAEVAWKKEGQDPPRQRTIPIAESLGVEETYLVRGGRWLLVATEYAAVVYYDLDSDNPIPISLVPPQPVKCRTKISVDVDEGSPYLKFTLALSYQTTHSELVKEQIEIWRVVLTFGSSPKSGGARLFAKLILSFPQEPFGRLASLSVLGDHVSYVLYHHPRDRSFIVITDWRQLPTLTNYPKRFMRWVLGDTHVRLLPGNKFVAQTEDTMFIYSFLSLPLETSLPTELQLTNRPWPSPLWYQHGRGDRDYAYIPPRVFRPSRYSNSDKIHLVLFARDRVHRLVLSEYDDVVKNPQSFETPWPSFQSKLFLFGWSRSFLWLGGWVFVLLRHQWSGGANEEGSSRDVSKRVDSGFVLKGSQRRNLHAHWGPVYDEESGRVVAVDDATRDIVVFEFAICK